jgi:hypothetical protein
VPLLLLVLVAVWLFFLRGKGTRDLGQLADGPAGITGPPVGSDQTNQSDQANPQSMAGQLDNLTQAIATLEGFGIPGARPTRDNNPGDVRAGPGMTGTDSPGGIATFADAGDGWDALGGWLTSHAAAHPDWDFYDLAHYYATGSTTGTPAEGEADPDTSAEYIADYMGVDPSTPFANVLE